MGLGRLSRRAGVLALLSFALVVAGYAYYGEGSGSVYVTAPIERGRILGIVKATGTVEAVVTVDVSSQLSGRIADVYVGFNDDVRAGQPIALVDPEIYAARVNEAKAALRVAKAAAQVHAASLERARVALENSRTARRMADAQFAAARAKQDEAERELQRKLQLARTGNAAHRDVEQAQSQRDAGAADLRALTEQQTMKDQAIAMSEADLRIAEADLENAEAVVDQKQAALEQATLDLDRTVLRAPIDGVVIKRDLNPGQTVAVNLEAKTLFQIANDLRQMEVHGKIDEADVGRLKVGQSVTFTVDAHPEKRFAGQVLQVRQAPEVVQNVVTYTAIISAPNPERLLLPGMTATLRISVSDTGETLKVPNAALRFRPREFSPSTAGEDRQPGLASPATLWRLGADGKPLPVRVGVGESDDAATQLVSGPIREGEQVIIGTAKGSGRTSLPGLRLAF